MLYLIVRKFEIEQAEQLRGTLCTQANETITLLQYTVDTELASEKTGTVT
ncbi:hypothetical protein CE143_15445 [Photorhabdus luminescens]|uniref:Uncharacterized protein n=1 Tax=Photorhabdus akhurstii TaxID=171438 RepID=A0ABX8LWT4_9GAMM|nr:hypothetical protein B0X70_15450 [Photorhabdus akhurstii]UJD76212.1 hypothetical protein CE143_15445 [Photorhabdus luminescens]